MFNIEIMKFIVRLAGATLLAWHLRRLLGSSIVPFGMYLTTILLIVDAPIIFALVSLAVVLIALGLGK